MQRDVAVVSLSVDPDRVLEQSHVVSWPFGVATGRGGAHPDDEPDLRAGYVLRGREHAAASHSLRNAEEEVRLIESWRRKAG